VTIASTTNRVSYAGNGSTLDFAFPHPYRASTDLVVTLRTVATGAETLQVEGTNYSVTGTPTTDAGGFASGTVTFTVAPAAGTQVHIDRVVPRTQPTDYVAGDGIPPSSIEGSLDRLTLQVQELDSRFERTLLQPRTAANRNLVLPEPTSATASRVLTVNTGGTAYELRAPDGVPNGDKGDITVSGAGDTWTIDDNAVTLAKMADMATASVIYRKTSGTGDPEVNTLATLKTDLGLTGTNSGDQTITLTGDVTGSGTGSFATAIGAGVIVNADVNADAAIDATKLSFLQAGSGAVARTVDSKLEDVVSVFDFMTTAQITSVKAGDLAENVTTPIQNAIDYCVSVGKSLLLPAGVYLVTAPLTIGGQIYIFGEGSPDTRISYSGNVNCFTVSGFNDGWGISKINFLHTGAAPTGGAAIAISSASNGYVRDVKFNYCYDCVTVTGCQNTDISGCVFWEFLRYGVFLNDDCITTYITKCFINGGITGGVAPNDVGLNTHGIYMYTKVDATYISQCDIILCQYGIRTNTVTAYRPGYSCVTDTFVDSCAFTVYLVWAKLLKFSGCWISSKSEEGVTLVETDAITFENSTITWCGKHGVLIDTTAKRTTINACVISGNSTVTPGLFSGIAVGANATDFSITNCVIGNNNLLPSGFNTGSHEYAISMSSGCSDYLISGNNLKNNATGAISGHSAGAGKIVDNNIGFDADLQIGDGKNIILGTTTGTKIGTATTQKLGFYDKTPVVQPAVTDDLLDSLQGLGLIASGSGNTPLDLSSGALTVGTLSSGVHTFSSGGSASAPVVTVSGDTDTGIFFPAGDTIAFTEGGSEAFRVNSSGNIEVTQSAGRGFGFGAGTFTFDSTSVPDYGFAYTSPTGEFNTVLAGFSNVKICVNQAERFRIDAGGNVGIGATSFGTSAAGVLGIKNGTAPGSGVADTVQFYSSDHAAGHTIPSFYCEGTDVVMTDQADSTSDIRIRVRINGTVYQLLAKAN
jgi:hypothetical protein